MNDRRMNFARTVGRGKAVASAREAGYELISEERLGDLLADLHSQGMIEFATNNIEEAILLTAKRGIEILRG